MKQLKKRDLLKVKFTEEVVKELLPEWSDARNMEIVVLEGGITNKLYRIKSDQGDVAVRIYGDRTEMFINRDWEAEAIEKMAAEQISPKLVKYIPEQKVTIVEFVTGCYTLKNPDFLKTELHELIVDPIRRIHRSKAKLSKLFDPPVEVEKMARILEKDVGASYPEFDIAGTLRKFRKLAEHTAIPKSEYTVSHNDLLAENFLLVQDPYKDRFPRPLYIIDWEYAGMAPRYYDLGDMFQEVLVPREVELAIVEHYCDGQCPQRHHAPDRPVQALPGHLLVPVGPDPEERLVDRVRLLHLRQGEVRQRAEEPALHREGIRNPAELRLFRNSRTVATIWSGCRPLSRSTSS